MEPLDVWRCPNCGRFLGRVCLTEGAALEVKCHYCKTVTRIVGVAVREGDGGEAGEEVKSIS